MKDKYIEEKLKEFDKKFEIEDDYRVLLGYDTDITNEVKQFLKETIQQTRKELLEEIEGVVVGEKKHLEYEDFEHAVDKGRYDVVYEYGIDIGRNQKRQETIEALIKLKE